MVRESTTYNSIVGVKDGEIFVLEETFKHSDTFKGAVGYSMRPLTQDDIDSGNDPEAVRDLWVDAVIGGHTDLGLEDYAEDMQRWCDGYYPCDDGSHRYQFNNLIDELPKKIQNKLKKIFGVRGEDYIDWQVSSGGRCFNSNDKWELVIDEYALELIKQFENDWE